jgi:hypothetical protein
MGIREQLTFPVIFVVILMVGVLHFYWAPQQQNNARENFISQWVKVSRPWKAT